MAGYDKDDNYMEPLPCPEPKTCSYCKYSGTSVSKEKKDKNRCLDGCKSGKVR